MGLSQQAAQARYLAAVSPPDRESVTMRRSPIILLAVLLAAVAVAGFSFFGRPPVLRSSPGAER